MAGMKTVLISSLLVSIFIHQAHSAAVFSRVLGKVFSTVSTCTDELQQKISPELCLSQFDGDSNPNDAQFDGCKQALTCAVKKLEFMTEDGQWDQTKLASLRDNIRDVQAVEEFDNMMKSCGSVSGSNGEAVINMISCILNSSDKAKQSYNELKETFMTGYD